MIYHLLFPLHKTISVFNVFRYITFRTIYASLTAFLICFLLGPWVIRKLSYMQIGQYIRDDGPETHHKKAGTPTMGGTLIIFSIIVSTLLWTNLTNYFVWIVLLVTTGYGAIGFVDDYLMQIKKQSKGLNVRNKFLLQTILAIFTGILVYTVPDFSTRVTVPFFKNISPDLGWGYILFAAFVIIGTSNAVNITDGLDGLAIGPFIIASAAYMVFAYVAGHFKIADYLQLALVGGLFVIETLSVIFQVGFFKMTNGRRIFRMAPLHHHFELKGWAEPKVIVRFWIIAIALALISMSTLKLR